MAHDSPTAAADRIAAAFARASGAGQAAVMPFVPAGFPDLPGTTAAIVAADGAGATLVEVGFPFSDPVADGPVIQAAFAAALARGVRADDVFAAVADARRAGATLPLVAMVSYSIVYRYGADRFFAAAAHAGFDGVLVPDLPPPEAEGVCERAWAAGLATTLLVAPTTTPARRAEIARLSTGFVYYLSVSGTTGERDRLPEDLAGNVAALRALTDRPVCVGFGLHTAEQVRQLSAVADGAIVGSAFVRRMADAAPGGTAAVAEVVAAYCRELMGFVIGDLRLVIGE